VGSAAPASEPAVPAASADLVSPTPDQSPPSGGQTAKRVGGIVAGVAGLGLLVAAGIEEAGALSHAADESKYSTSTPAGHAARNTVTDQSQQLQTYAIILGAGGVVALGAGIILLVTSGGDSGPHATAQAAFHGAPYAGPHEAGWSFGGTF
jgi:hypothetical protein